MERVLQRRIPVWAVGLLCVLGVVGAIVFANVAVFYAKKPGNMSPFREPVMAVADVQAFLRQMDQNFYLMVPEGVHEGKAGFSYSYPAGSRPDAGFLLLSRYDGDDQRAYAELVDLNAQRTVHRWAPEIEPIFAESQLETVFLDAETDLTEVRTLYRHPLPTDDGGLIIKSKSPLVKVDVCGSLAWMNDDSAFHHSLEQDADGNFWGGGLLESKDVPHVNPNTFRHDWLVQVDPEGSTLRELSVPKILEANGRLHLVYRFDAKSPDPTHLNDIQPVLEDGPHWKKGDLFVSLRGPSMVFLYRPSTNKIIWSHSGDWYGQHDVDILDDHRISVFNNNAAQTWRAVDDNDVLVYDFENREISAPWHDALQQNGVRTTTEGLARVLPGNDLFVEEQNSGRLLRLSTTGDVVWEYVNRAEMGQVFRLGWSTFLTNDEAAPILHSIAQTRCDQHVAGAKQNRG